MAEMTFPSFEPLGFFQAHHYGVYQVGLLWVLAFAALMLLRLVT